MVDALAGAGRETKASSGGEDTLTGRLVDRVRRIRWATLPTDVVTLTKHCLLDWLGVTFAGLREPSAALVREELTAQAGTAESTMLGSAHRVPSRSAALANGTAAHALDFDDVLPAMLGHPSAPLWPAVLALGERERISGQQLLEAFVIGFETEAVLGRSVEPGHHDQGWHTTATLGTFASTAAAVQLLGLTRQQWLAAFGIAGTQASGLKSMFGTMTKPFHAGKAATDGLLAASLAARGMTAATDVIEAPHGFAHLMTDTFQPEALDSTPRHEFDLRTVLFKQHASCFLTHSAIDGLRSVCRHASLAAADINRIDLVVSSTHLTTCPVRRPSTSLEAKFSLPMTAALAVMGGTVGEQEFTDERIFDPALLELADRITATVSDGTSSLLCTPVSVTCTDGRVFTECVDVGQPTPADELEGQQERLLNKYDTLASPVLGQPTAKAVAQRILEIETEPDISTLMAAVRGAC